MSIAAVFIIIFYIIIGTIEENIILISIVVIEIFPIFYTTKAALALVMKKFRAKKEKILLRCTHDTKFRNRIASYLFFFSDMGPSVSSFSVIALFITTEDNVRDLTLVFIFGIIMKEIFRGFKNKFYEAIKKRSS